MKQFIQSVSGGDVEGGASNEIFVPVQSSSGNLLGYRINNHTKSTDTTFSAEGGLIIPVGFSKIIKAEVRSISTQGGAVGFRAKASSVNSTKPLTAPGAMGTEILSYSVDTPAFSCAVVDITAAFSGLTTATGDIIGVELSRAKTSDVGDTLGTYTSLIGVKYTFA